MAAGQYLRGMVVLVVVLVTFDLGLVEVVEGSPSSIGVFAGICPEPICDCDLDERGRMEVSCLHGRMVDIPTSKINPSTEVIRIVAPPNQPNQLAIGRFFRQFKRLEELHIVGSNIPNIGENSFWGVQSLRVLNLTGNNISIIIDTNFKGLVNVETLSLAENSIESFVSASFQHLPKLKSLDLSDNRVNKLVERLFYNLHMLEILDLSGNWIRELNPDVFRDIWRLKELRCRRCGLKTINPLLYALLPDLRILDLGSNEFKYLNREEFGGLVRLETLYLDGNQISAITDETFRSLRLKFLSLSSNRIVRIDRHAFANSTIERLDLSGNKFESLDRLTFGDIKRNLLELDLSRNPRLKLSPLLIILAENPQLKWLSLAKNQYEDLPLDLFELQNELLFLNLSGNQLVDLFPHQLSHLYKLQYLDLSYNKFKGIDPDVLAHIQRLKGFKHVNLEGNPWVCDLCNIQGLLRWIQTTQYFNAGCSDPYGPPPHCLRCSAPPSLLDKSLMTIEESQLDWCNNGAEPISILSDDPRLGLFIGCALIMIILIIAAVAIIIRARWHAAHYYTHEGDRPEITPPPVPPDFDTREASNISQHTNGFDNLYYNNGNYKNNKMIATIDEINYVDAPYPELDSHHHHHITDTTNIMLPPPSSYR